jgi:hypothetical protein
MSRTFHHGERRIRIHGVLKSQPDRRRAARAIIKLAQLQAEAEAEIEDTKRRRPEPKDSSPSATRSSE